MSYFTLKSSKVVSFCPQTPRQPEAPLQNPW